MPNIVAERSPKAAHHSPSSLIWQLSDADLVRLKRVAQLRARSTGGVDWEDLLHEAIVRVAEGRRCAAGCTSILLLVIQTIRSLASDLRRRNIVAARALTSVAPMLLTIDEHSPETCLIYKEQLSELDRLFSDDPQASEFLSLIQLGMSGAEAARRMNLDHTEYETLRKRVRRHLSRYLSVGKRTWQSRRTQKP